MSFLNIGLFFTFAVLPLPAQTMDAFQRGLISLKENHPTEALEQLTLAEQKNPHDARVRNFRGIALAQMGRSDEAAAEYREAIRLNPTLTDAYRNLGHLEWMRRRPEEARRALTGALKLSPDDLYANYYLGRVEFDSSNYSQAFTHLEKCRNLWSDDPDFCLDLAKVFLSLRREADARQALSHMRNAKLTNRQLIRYGALLLAAKDGGAGVEVFRRIRNAHPNAAWALFNLALAHLLAGQSQEALSTAQSLATPQGPAGAWTIIGIAAAQNQDHDRSIAAFRMAARLAPDQEERWLDVTRELMAGQHYTDAVAEIQQGLDYLPRSYTLRLRLGAAYTKSGQYKKAEGVFRDLIAKEDPQPTSTIGLVQVLLREAQPDAAVQVLDEAEKHWGDNFLLAYFHGIAFDRAARPEQAIERFRQAVRLNPQSAEAHQWLGKVELRAGQVDQAIADLKKALRLNPNHQPARRLLAQAYAVRKQPDQAAQYLRKIEPGEVPKTLGNESQDFFFPAWEFPPTVQ